MRWTRSGGARATRWLVVTAMASACVGPEGPQGPQGPQGAMGATGATGATGAMGATGATGPAGPAGPTGPGVDAGVVDASAPRPTRLLDARIAGWIPRNRERINAMIAARGITSPGYDPMNRPVAAFDWDNTMLKNDIGDATFFWMVRNDKVLQPPGRDWSRTSAALTPAARAALNAACDALADAGAPLPTSRGTASACASEIVNIYYNARTIGGMAAWANEVTYTTNQPYAWAAQLLGGYTAGEIRSFARAAFDENHNNAIGATQSIGSVTGLNAYVRVYDAMRDLVGTLQQNGFDVWVVSASPQQVVEVAAEQVGVRADHVIGIRSVFENGRATYNFQGCGTVADGANTLITFDRGKRCWINRVIFGVAPAQQMERQPEGRRPVFAAGDSDTDLAFVQDATALKLVLNRGKVQLMCNAYGNAMDRWLVQPMFIAPRAMRATPYPCTTATDAAGMPIVDENGARFPMDLADSVYALP
ncbi:MAG: haloacid dehalogenase-like hydrolase [Polyangiales bacterium]